MNFSIMNEEERGSFLEEVFDDYTRKFQKNYMCSQGEAERTIAKQREEVLSSYTQKDHHFWNIENEDLRVGTLWCFKREEFPNTLHIGFLEIFKEHQKKGFALKVGEYLKEWAKDNKFKGLSLSVFGDDMELATQYQKFGFKLSKQEMLLRVDTDAETYP